MLNFVLGQFSALDESLLISHAHGTVIKVRVSHEELIFRLFACRSLSLKMIFNVSFSYTRK